MIQLKCTAIFSLLMGVLLSGYPDSLHAGDKADLPLFTRQDKAKADTGKEEVPHFKNDKANKDIAAFNKIMHDYGSALGSHNADSIMEFSSRISEWSKNANEWMEELDKEERDALNNYINAVIKQHQPQPPVLKSQN